MCERVAGKLDATETPIGLMPCAGDLDLTGLDIPAEDMAELMKVDVELWRGEIPMIEESLGTFGDKLPKRMTDQLEALRKRLG